MKVKLGHSYSDRISGFEGVASGRHEYLHGYIRWTLSGVLNGEPKEFTFDEPQLELVKRDFDPEIPTRESGGPRSTPSRVGL